MAKLCVVCSSFYALFLLFSNIAAVLSISDYYFYGLGNYKSEYLTVKLLFNEGEHRLQKRNIQTDNNQSNAPGQVNGPTVVSHPNDTATVQNQSNNVDEGIIVANKTLTDNKISITYTDNHLYYNSTLKTDPEIGSYYWVDLKNRSDAETNKLLSKSYRKAVTVQLSFEFPFYGYLIKNMKITTGGFLYTGDYVHSWLAATQYIAPLMANFDTSISNDSYIRYVDNGTAFTVEWDKVVLRDQPNEGEFTFQTTLHQNGDIVFVYRNVPSAIENIKDDHHPIKVGLSDAYIIDRTVFSVRRKTIYEYHRINFFKEDIKNWTVIYLTALPTCVQSQDCISCFTETVPSLKCHWCPSANRCSNGLDRHREDWLAKDCDKKGINKETMCSQMNGLDT